jgi:hypothetical protein
MEIEGKQVFTELSELVGCTRAPGVVDRPCDTPCPESDGAARRDDEE